MPPDSGNGRIAKGGGAAGAPTLESALLDRARGCLVGAAVGDALGGATEGRSAEAIVAHYGGHVTGVVQSMTQALGDRPLAPFHKGDGHVTDDTLLTHALVRVYELKRDHLDAYDVERLLVPELIGQQVWIPELGRDELLVQRLFLAEKWLVLRLHYGHVDPREAGVGNIVNCGAAMYAAPIGIANAGSAYGAYREAVDVAGAHQSSYGREAAGVFAAAVAGGAETGGDARLGRRVLPLAGAGWDARRDRAGLRRRERPRRLAWGARQAACGRRAVRHGRAPSTPSQGSAHAGRAACTASRSSRSRSGCCSRPAAITGRRCSAASTTAATPTRSERWAARSRARSAVAAPSRTSGSSRSRTRAASISRRRAATMAEVAAAIWARDLERERLRARTLGEPECA